MSTLAVPLFIAAVGIILRGTAYALRVGTRQRRASCAPSTSSSRSRRSSSPFAFGAAIGGIASGRVPVGNAEGDLVHELAQPDVVPRRRARGRRRPRTSRPSTSPPTRCASGRARAGRGVPRARARDGRRRRRDRDRPGCSSCATTRGRSGTGSRAAGVSARWSSRRSRAAATMLLVWIAPLRPGARDGRGRGRRGARRLGARAAARRAARPLDPPGRRRPLDARRARDRDRDRRRAADPVARDPLRPAARRPLRRRAGPPGASAPGGREPGRSRLLPVAAVLLGVGTMLTVFFDAPVTLTLGILALFAFGVCGFLVLAAPVEADR